MFIPVWVLAGCSVCYSRFLGFVRGLDCCFVAFVHWCVFGFWGLDEFGGFVSWIWGTGFVTAILFVVRGLVMNALRELAFIWCLCVLWVRRFGFWV